MDVSSLYPNIDHQEGIDACETALNTRTSQSVPTSVLCDLIMTILKCNTLKFGERFLHQIQGTAMGTPMAVNLANLFMGKFETDLMNDYRNKRDSKMRVLAQTTTFTTFVARQRNRWKFVISLFTLSPTICYPSSYNLVFMKSQNCAP